MGDHPYVPIDVIRERDFFVVLRDLLVVQFFEGRSALVRPTSAVNYAAKPRLSDSLRRLANVQSVLFRRFAIRVGVNGHLSDFCVVIISATLRTRRPAFRVLVLVVVGVSRYWFVNAV